MLLQKTKPMTSKINITLLLLCFVFIFSCKNDDADNTNEAKTEKVTTKRIPNYSCANFFTKGDYSSLCISSDKLPHNTTTEKTANEIHCTYLLTKDSTPSRDAVKVSFMSFGDTEDASNFFIRRRENVKEGKTEFKVRDTDAYMETAASNNGKNNAKMITFTYRNIMISISIAYYKPWIKVMPCFYDDSELKKLAELVYDNIKV
jgi:hypothetical protein